MDASECNEFFCYKNVHNSITLICINSLYLFSHCAKYLARSIFLRASCKTTSWFRIHCLNWYQNLSCLKKSVKSVKTQSYGLCRCLNPITCMVQVCLILSPCTTTTLRVLSVLQFEENITEFKAPMNGPVQ